MLNDVVTGTLFSRIARALFDPGATHSLSRIFACYADKPVKPLICGMSIATPIGDCMVVNYIYKTCGIVQNDRKFLVDILPLEKNDFDVILGIDWVVS